MKVRDPQFAQNSDKTTRAENETKKDAAGTSPKSMSEIFLIFLHDLLYEHCE